MQVDYAVELGRDDETLDLPWATPGGGPRYYDLKRDHDAIEYIEEAARAIELREFLISVNSKASLLESAKCDAWSSTEINPEEKIFDLPWKFGSYVDLLFSEQEPRFSFEQHEKLLKELTGLLKRAPEIPDSVEFLLRRCFFHENDDVREGYHITFYLFGYGKHEAEARLQWGIGLKLVTAAISQLSFRPSAL
ncbi:MAG TPA: hypothetical protein VLL05_05555 [Terriglobales bacterium]|nr:hypothetical protein [Terriglobales bacterium]